MAARQVLELEAILTPIPGDNPAGESLRYAGVYDAIGEARRADDDLPMGEWARGEVKTADWSTVIELAIEALAARSKDLPIAVWLTEALVKQHGFAGLHDGLRLLAELQERFWDALYPEAEDGDLEFRAAPLEWLNEKLPAAINSRNALLTTCTIWMPDWSPPSVPSVAVTRVMMPVPIRES